MSTESLPSSNQVSQSADYSRGGNLLPLVEGLEVDVILVDLKFIAKSGKKQQPAWNVKIEILSSSAPEVAEGRKYDLYFTLGGAHDVGHKKWASFLGMLKGLAPNTPFDSDAYRNELLAAANTGKLRDKELLFKIARRVDSVNSASIVDGKPVLVTNKFPNDTYTKIAA